MSIGLRWRCARPPLLGVKKVPESLRQLEQAKGIQKDRTTPPKAPKSLPKVPKGHPGASPRALKSEPKKGLWNREPSFPESDLPCR